MAKHQLIINDRHQEFPLRSEGGELKATRTLVVNWKGTWAPSDVPGDCLVVTPGDELEFVFALQIRAIAMISLRSASEHPLLVPAEDFDSQSRQERITLQGSRSFEVNRTLPPNSGELRYDLFMRVRPNFGGGNADTMAAGKP